MFACHDVLMLLFARLVPVRRRSCFVSQNPADIPHNILGQLGLRIQQAMRAYTRNNRDEIKTMANNFRENSSLEAEIIVTVLVTGEGLVSILDEKGRPSPFERVLIYLPQSKIGVIFGSARECKESLVRNDCARTLGVKRH